MHKKWKWPRNMVLLKNPQFLPNYYETWSKCPTIELVILTKFDNNWVKIVDFYYDLISGSVPFFMHKSLDP